MLIAASPITLRERVTMQFDAALAAQDTLQESEVELGADWRIEIADVFIPLYPSDPMAAAIKTLLRARYAAIECVRTMRRFKEKLS
jgi:hypothetical protein